MADLPNGDLMEGAEEIAHFLRSISSAGCRDKWTRRRVYNVQQAGGLPIFTIPGVGLAARKSAILDHFTALESQAVENVGMDAGNDAA